MAYLLILCSALTAMMPDVSVASVPREAKVEKTMFDRQSMDHLSFLEGRWSGKAPDGSMFYEEYTRVDPATLRSSRYKDATFAEVTDGSVVTLKDGQITSTWGEFTWRAVTITDGLASFEPVNAPSAFTWRRVDAATVEVTQKWTDEKGAAQAYTLTLQRVR